MTSDQLSVLTAPESISSVLVSNNGNPDLRVVRQLDESKWRSFIDKHPLANIYHTPEMFAVYELSDGYKPNLWATIDSEGKPYALFLPVEVSVMGGIVRSFTTRAVSFGSVLCAEGPVGMKALDLLLEQYGQSEAKRVLFTELRNMENNSHLEGLLSQHGYVLEGHLNYLIDLDQTEDALWQLISKSTRKHIRSAEKQGVIIEEMTDIKEMDEAYALLQEVYSRVQVPLASKSVFNASFELLAPKGMLKIFFARLNGQNVGVRMLLPFKTRVFDWYAGADNSLLSYYPNETLVWHTLKWGKANGYQLFDFGGAGKPDEDYGPRVFKSRFGGTLVNYGRYTNVPANWRLSLSTAGYKIARKFIS